MKQRDRWKALPLLMVLMTIITSNGAVDVYCFGPGVACAGTGSNPTVIDLRECKAHNGCVDHTFKALGSTGGTRDCKLTWRFGMYMNT